MLINLIIFEIIKTITIVIMDKNICDRGIKEIFFYGLKHNF